MKVGRLILCLIVITQLVLVAPAVAQNSDEKFDSSKYVAAIRKVKILDPNQPIVVKRFQGALIVTTLINPKAKVDDCKIDSMLVSKAVMDLDNTIHMVRYRLKSDMNADAFYLIVVKESDVKAYGASAINKESLLAGLQVVAKKGSENRLNNFRKRRSNF